MGQNWERAALIKARPVAGDLALGERFLADLAPFIWRKYFDFASIADVHAMKRQIHAVRGHDEIAVAGHDIKLGRGGIREIEFFVQTQQLVFGGRRPACAAGAPSTCLSSCIDEGWITAKARDELVATPTVSCARSSTACRWWRTSRRNACRPTRTHLKRFAKFCGFPGRKAFAEALCGHARKVQAHYALLFEEGPELASEVGNLVFTGSGDDPETLATLRRLGFHTSGAAPPRRCAAGISDAAPAITSARAREVLTELTPVSARRARRHGGSRTQRSPPSTAPSGACRPSSNC